MSDIEAERMSAADFAAYNQRIADLKNQAETNLGGQITQVAPNGDCLFLAIADQEGAGQERANELRALAMRTIDEKCLTEYSDVIAGDDLDLPDATARERCDAYVAKYGRKGEYGGDLELRALSQALNVNIEVYRVPRQVTKYPNPPGVGQTYKLIFYGEGTYPHYDSIRFPTIKSVTPNGSRRLGAEMLARSVLLTARALAAKYAPSAGSGPSAPKSSGPSAGSWFSPSAPSRGSWFSPKSPSSGSWFSPTAGPSAPSSGSWFSPKSPSAPSSGSWFSPKSPSAGPPSPADIKKPKMAQYQKWMDKYKNHTIAAEVNEYMTLKAQTAVAAQEQLKDPQFRKIAEFMEADAEDPQFRDREILIDDELMTIVNPYKAAQYRGDPALTTWSSGSSFNSGEMFERDNAIVQKIVPQLLSDRRAVSAILESLWFCGTKQEIGSNPYCFPERYLGMLRKYGSKAVRFAEPDPEAEAAEEAEEAEVEEVEEAEAEAEAPEEAKAPASATQKSHAGDIRVKTVKEARAAASNPSS